MMIERLFDSTAVTYRETLVAPSTIKKAYTIYLTSFNCNVQPLEPTLGQAMPGSFGKQWVMFCTVQDFKEGDKVIVNDVDEYRVAGVELFQLGGEKHAEVILRAFKE